MHYAKNVTMTVTRCNLQKIIMLDLICNLYDVDVGVCLV